MIRYAAVDDLETMMKIYETARMTMRRCGNMHQWINGYPNRELLKRDIETHNSYLIEENGETVGVFTFMMGEDPTYGFIEDGSWLNDEPYGVIHRIASANRQKNILHTALMFAFSKTDNVRIDTHRDNVIMRHLLEKEGFTHCGTIYLESGDTRLAYHKKMK